MQQEQDGRDESPGMAYAYPPDEVRDGKPPGYGDVHAPDSYAYEDEPGDCVEQDHKPEERDAKAYEPANRRLALEHNGADLVGD